MILHFHEVGERSLLYIFLIFLPYKKHAQFQLRRLGRHRRGTSRVLRETGALTTNLLKYTSCYI